ncbi:MAG: hypothetical protein FWE90_14110 [Defluviitaleaceae bacterium]|nr:hypothetical protein [Defluviitaleaceae bacterium]
MNEKLFRRMNMRRHIPLAALHTPGGLSTTPCGTIPNRSVSVLPPAYG